MSKLKYAYLFRQDFKNPGDLYSSVLNYFTSDKQGAVFDIKYNDTFETNVEVDVVFIGGGAVFSTSKFVDSIEKMLSKIKAKHKIVWGVGATIDGVGAIKSKFDLFGVRDFNFNNHIWVPCPSVLHNKIFRHLKTVPNKKFLIVDHWKRPIEFPYEHTRICNKPNTIDVVMENIANHEYVFTSSYHAAYWATLLKRKTYVIGDQLPSKFYTMKHSPVIASSFKDNLLDQPLIWENSFEECIEANQNFRNKVEDLIGVKFDFINTNFN